MSRRSLLWTTNSRTARRWCIWGALAALFACCLVAAARGLRRPAAACQEVERQRVKAAFLYMMGPGSAANLAQSLGLLHANHRRWHPYKVLVFAPQDVTPKDLSELRALTDPTALAGVEFVALGNFSAPPEGVDAAEVDLGIYNIGKPVAYPGYGHMASWYFSKVFDHPRVAALDFYARLDTDSKVTSPIRYDLFAFMRDNGFSYGFNAKQVEGAVFIQGLWDFVLQYVRDTQNTVAEANGLLKYAPSSERPGSDNLYGCFYNNFEVARVARFREADVADFTARVAASGMIFKRRWGDAPLRWFQVMLHLSLADEVHRFRDFEYRHRHADHGLNYTVVGLDDKLIFSEYYPAAPP